MKLPKVNNKLLLIISCVVMIMLGLMIFSNKKYSTQKSQVSESSPYEKEIQQAKTQSNSDDIDLIEQDLKNTNYENLEAELSQIEKEVGADY